MGAVRFRGRTHSKQENWRFQVMRCEIRQRGELDHEKKIGSFFPVFSVIDDQYPEAYTSGKLKMYMIVSRIG